MHSQLARTHSPWIGGTSVVWGEQVVEAEVGMLPAEKGPLVIVTAAPPRPPHNYHHGTHLFPLDVGLYASPSHSLVTPAKPAPPLTLSLGTGMCVPILVGPAMSAVAIIMAMTHAHFLYAENK
jgi:hypothetical protein